MDDYDYYGWKPYVSVAARRAQAARELAKLAKKGHRASPVVIDGRTIAKTFWGKAWCDNLEGYSDFANRLPRGRTYVRNGSVVDLRIAAGAVTALVSGSSMYEVRVTVAAVPSAQWSAICGDCTGAIDSLVELLQGRFSKGVMARICQPNAGLFPLPKEIAFTCSCPDWASMCKHVAAVLYGIGARLDEQPELLFTLRKVDQQDLIATAGTGLAQKGTGPTSAKVLGGDDLSEMFGIEMAPIEKPRRSSRPRPAPKRAPAPTPEESPTSRAPARKPAKKAVPQFPTVTLKAKGRWTAAAKQAVADRMRTYWAARRKALGRNALPAVTPKAKRK